METRELLNMVRQLGREYRKRGMSTHLPALRVYWLALQHELTQRQRHQLDVSYSEDLVTEWFKLLRLEPFASAYPILRAGSPCPNCPRQEGHAVEVITEKTFPDGRKVICMRCRAAWLELEAPNWVQRVGRGGTGTPSGLKS